MKLQNPITIKLPDITLRNGRVRSVPPLVLKELKFTIIDNESEKTAKALISPFKKHFVLWEGDAYVAAGDYTQAQAESRIMEILGEDPAKTLEGHL